MYSKHDVETVRELAKRYIEIANSEKHVKMRERFRATNDLKIVRPPVIVEELPWHEMNMDGALDCVCEDGGLRGIEYSFRVALFREKYFKCDNFIEPVFAVGKSYSSTGNGLAVTERRLAADARNSIVSHAYADVLEDERALEAFRDPVITAHPENDAKKRRVLRRDPRRHHAGRAARARDLLRAVDTISTLRGVEPILADIYERRNICIR